MQVLGKKDILATLHPGLPEGESSSLGASQRKALSVLPNLVHDQTAGGSQSNRGSNGRRAGHFGFAVLQCGSKSYLLANLTIKKNHSWARPVK